MSSFGSWQDHVPDVLALVPWADMMRHSSEAGEPSTATHIHKLAIGP